MSAFPPSPYPSVIPPDAYAKVAAELVAEYRPAAEVLAEWGLGMPGSDPRTDALYQNPGFQEILGQITAELEGADNTIKRIRLKSALAVEHALPVISGMIASPDAGIKERIEAFRQLSKMAGVEEDAKNNAQNTTDSRFIINISVPNGAAEATPMVTISAGAEPQPSLSQPEPEFDIFGQPL